VIVWTLTADTGIMGFIATTVFAIMLTIAAEFHWQFHQKETQRTTYT
jgi:hypothetical protein